ncbi:MAG: hypothetical protein IJO01_04645 [Oscillospiraceae bacterium]|nr:hypothetical protein [Oscillospiraceae bacterium]
MKDIIEKIFSFFKKEETTAKSEEKEEAVILRNGFGVTKDKDANIAEQWVNIMNYNGQSQREEDYEQ